MSSGGHGHDPVRVGLSGGGFMGRALLHQCAVTPDVRCTVMANRSLRRAVAAAQAEGIRYRVVHDPRALARAVEAGELAIVGEGALLAESDQVDVLLEATASVAPAGRLAELALGRGKHVVMINAEADLVFGPYLTALARRSGAVYTSADGDQHTVLKRLADDLLLWGFEIALAGNIKGYLNRYATPTSIVGEADKRDLSYVIATALTDGTKLNVEMALVANALGLRAAVPGMLGPRATRVEEAPRLFDLEGAGTVDYLLGAEPGGGVFIVARCEDPFQRKMLGYYKMGPGPHYLFYRHYHLCHVEALRTVLEAAREGRALLQPAFGLRTNVIAYAKRDLASGEVLDGIGGFTCYGMIENVGHGEGRGLPIALAEGAVARRAIARDERIALADVDYEEEREDFRMHAQSAGS